MSRDFSCIPDVRAGLHRIQGDISAEIQRLRDHGLNDTADNLRGSLKFLRTYTDKGMMLDCLEAPDQ
ncbi:hypothetical protein [uncultured Roseobacter sp.]|uniref:hypothetical protein n=1 Tax=uncultured Roseobacter sp. TaxID=114847 RepID=UPI00261CF3E4|nr:hypothetical protein [uncultured Roseobacter sp.]